MGDLPARGRPDARLAHAGTDALAAGIKEIGAAPSIAALGVTPAMIEDVASSVIIFDSGYHKLSHQEVVDILQASL